VTVVDERGRVFGRINLVDGAVVLVLLLLIPLAYGTYLLFKPATPHIDSVEPSIITKEEQRISAGGRLIAKFKVRGGGFTPLLRARIGDADALGLVFETPNAADVLVGPMPPGAHDLVLLDGVQEVARATGVITIQPSTSITVRAVGWITSLDKNTAEVIKVGTALPEGAPLYRVIALGPLVPGYQRVSLAGSSVDVPAAGTHARAAVLALECDTVQGETPCSLGERIENRTAPVTLSLPAPGRAFIFAIDELLPSTPPARATIQVRLAPGAPAAVRQGDRDNLIDERAAVVSSAGGDLITLEAGVDRDHAGWRYRGQRLVPGARFVWSTDRYEAAGTVQSLDVKAAQP
jgi:hypothetical protein